LLDFFESSPGKGEVNDFLWDRFLRACASEFTPASLFVSLYRLKLTLWIIGGCDDQYPFPETFLKFLVGIPVWGLHSFFEGVKSELVLTPARADWWMSLAMARKADKSLFFLFSSAHSGLEVRTVPNVFQTSH
jgi:hypothetical protein